MKKKLFIFILALMTLVLTACSSKNIFTITIDSNYDDYIILGTSADYPPYESLKTVNDKLTVVGIDIELAKEIAKALNKNLKVINRDFDFLLEDLKAGKVDFVISGMNPTPERLEQVDFSNIYYEATHSVLINKTNIESYLSEEDLNISNLKIGAQLGSIQQDIAEETFNNAQKVYLKNINDLIFQLNDNKLDAIILETPVATSFESKHNNLIKTNFTVGSTEDGTAVAVQKGNSDLLNTINDVIDQLILSGEMDEIINDAILNDTVEPNKLLSKSYLILLLQGVLMTIVLAFLSVTLGSILGLLITTLRLSNNKILSNVAKWYVEIVRGTPLLVQVLLIYSLFNIPVILFLGIDLSSFIPGVLALLINSSAYVSEIFRGGIEAVDSGQTEAGLSLGMSNKSIMKKIVLPQAIKNIIPSLGNEFITMIKETSIFMYLGVAELMYNASIIKAETFQIKEVYILTALVYLVLTLTTSKLLSIYQKKLGEKYEK